MIVNIITRRCCVSINQSVFFTQDVGDGDVTIPPIPPDDQSQTLLSLDEPTTDGGMFFVDTPLTSVKN